ncbi:histidine kinase dimerization/phospho-acceptor domain-containing protein [Granulosicoccaceae sp. 1_MG-2023]|nr:histidine kinase dimerization/phospho-acceptor domain-containing protein [Granulosicoccaceae sp. 1_MG-2023]
MASTDSTQQHRLTDTPDTTPAADWYALRLLGNYRLILLVGMTALFYLSPEPSVLGQANHALFHQALMVYLAAGVVFNHLIRIRKPAHDTQLYLQAYADIIFLSVLMFASGGIESGLGMLMIANIAIIGAFTPARYTFLFAAIATTAVLAQETYLSMLAHVQSGSFIKSGILGISLFAVAYITSVVMRRFFPARSDEKALLETMFRAEELNQHIIENMDSGLIVIDPEWQIRLINQSAARLIGWQAGSERVYLSQVSPALQNSFLQWKREPYAGIKPFRAERNEMELLPHFSALGRHGTLISLEDYSLVAHQVQQLKLASLGGLTASIAHEIRNPLAAIANAVQLLDENDSLPAEDHRLLGIAERHCQRINRIIEDILQLSRRDKSHPENIDLQAFLTQFSNRCHEAVSIRVHCPEAVEVQFDVSHLEQILANLCGNTVAHNPNRDDLSIELHVEQIPGAPRIALNIRDNGCGIDADKADDIFEPFFTTRHDGTGLGLFIIRELCEANHARISCLPSPLGADFRLLLSTSRETQP